MGLKAEDLKGRYLYNTNYVIVNTGIVQECAFLPLSIDKYLTGLGKILPVKAVSFTQMRNYILKGHIPHTHSHMPCQ